MKTYLLAGLLMAFCIGCKCEGSGKVTAIVFNQSGGDITINFYKNGTTYRSTYFGSNNILILDKGTKIVDMVSSGRGKLSGGVAPFAFIDSLIVVFHSNKKAVYYFSNVTGKNPNALLANSPRSLFNENSYARKTIIDDKCYLETELIYTFTEQDYLSAR